MYPAGIHLGISNAVQLLYMLGLAVIFGDRAFYDGSLLSGFTVEITGIAGLLAAAACSFLYRNDCRNRAYGRLIPSPPGVRISASSGIFLLMIGASLSLYGNVIINFISGFFRIGMDFYTEQMDQVSSGKSLLFLIFFLGIAAPVAEETVFRWLVYLRLRDAFGIWPSVLLSSAFFGIYHGNLVQALYAGLLGAVFAFSLEMTGNLWSPVLLHVGANVFSLMLDEYGEAAASSWAGGMIYMGMFGILFIVLAAGIVWLARSGFSRGYRAV